MYITYDLPVGPAIPGPPIRPDGPARPVGPGLPISPLAPRSPAKPGIYMKNKRMVQPQLMVIDASQVPTHLTLTSFCLL